MHMKIVPITKIKLQFMKIVLIHIFSQYLDGELNDKSKEMIKDNCTDLVKIIDNKMEEE